MNPVLIHNWQYLDNGWSLIDSLGAVIDLYALPGREAISRDLCLSAKPSMLLLGWFLKFHFGIKILISDSTGFAMSAPYGDPSQDTIYSSDPPWHRLQFHQTMQGCKQTIPTQCVLHSTGFAPIWTLGYELQTQFLNFQPEFWPTPGSVRL